jgi:putative ABC transport system permease protein
MDTLRQDIRYALRWLLKSPGFTVMSALTVALGVGANSAIFSVVYGVLLRPLPYPEPGRLAAIYHLYEGRRSTISGPNFIDLAQRAQTLSGVAAIARSRIILTGEGEPTRLDGARVSASLFDVLAVQPLHGRTFRADENQPGRHRVVLLSYGLWQQRFAGDPRVVGRSIVLDSVSHEVIGVMPQGFAYPVDRVLWLPIEYSENFTVKQRGAWYLTVVSRLKPGVPLENAGAEVATIGQQLAAQYPNDNEGVSMTAVPLLEATVGEVRRAVLVLAGAVGFVLLIACGNVANLLLARAAAREGEMAVRAALGAGRGRLVRQLLTESVLLSVTGAALGLLLAVWGVDLLIALQPEGIPRLGSVRVDAVVTLFTMALAVLTGVLFGLVPAWHGTRDGMAGTLKEAGRGAPSSRRGARLRGGLVVVEMALAVTLLAGAGLLIRSFSRLAAVDPGFDVQQALTFELSLPAARYEDNEARQIAFFDQLLPSLRALPGVQAAGAVLTLPLTGGGIVLSFTVDGRPPIPPAQQPTMQVRVASAEYFETVGIPVKRGRSFTERDRAGSAPVIVITESAMRQFFPNDDPIGKRITIGWGRGPGTPRAGGEIVGVVGDVKDVGLGEPGAPQVYLPYRQWPVGSMAVVLRTSVPPGTVTDMARQAVQAVDPELPIANVRTLDQIVARSISQPRFYTTLLGVFALVALALAATGIFGVLSYAVTQRTREIGIRMALGARQGAVVGLVVRDAMLLACAGIAVGVVSAAYLSRTLSTLLFEIPPGDPATFAGVASLLLVVALVASYAPARRATAVDPLSALRSE